MRLHQLVYVSQPAPRLGESDIEAILRSARTRNAREGLTGFLAFNAEVFLQIIEGTPAALSSCLQRLMHDPRHTQMCLIGFDAIDARSFSSWGMGYAALHAQHAALVARYCGVGLLGPQSITPAGARGLLTDLAREAAPAARRSRAAVSASSTQLPVE